jgi:hypothetical protein
VKWREKNGQFQTLAIYQDFYAELAKFVVSPGHTMKDIYCTLYIPVILKVSRFVKFCLLTAF